MLSPADGNFLVRLARRAIECELEGKKCGLAAPKPMPERGVFVTLTTKGRGLRGCIGFPEPVAPLDKAVADAALCAAFKDPRFPPVAKEELKGLVVEVSVLSEMELLKKPPKNYPDQIRIGAHGLVIDHLGCRGLMLPQVAPEQGWDAEEFLCHVCMKAGLPPDAWMDERAKLWRFSAQVFAERK